MVPPESDDRPFDLHPLLMPPEEEEFLRKQIASSPEPPSLVHLLTRYQAKNGLPADRQQCLVLTSLSGQSPFLGELLLQNPDYLPWAAAHLGTEKPRTAEDL